MIRAVSTFLHPGERPAQEDHLLALQEKGILVVADGFGGAASGAGAARTACESVRSFLVKEAGDLEATLPFVLRQYFSLAGNVLFNALIHANRQLMQLNRPRSVHEKGGASVIAAFLDGDLLALANVGCCTAWLFRDGRAVELVMPRTYGRLLDPLDGNRANPQTQVPLMAIGLTEDLEPEICEYRMRPGDWLLLSTDGVPPEVRERLLELHRSRRPAAEAAEAAVNEYKSGRYIDNAASALVIF